MLKALRIENFKAFGDLQEIPLAPVTLIYGPNSAGKSSIIQSIMLMRQSTAGGQPNNSRILFSGEDVDLGTYTAALFRHEEARKIKFGFSFSAPRRRFVYPGPTFSRTGIRSVDMTLDLTDGARRDKHHESWITEVLYGYEGKERHSVKLVRKNSIEEDVDPGAPSYSVFQLADSDSVGALLHLWQHPDGLTDQEATDRKTIATLRKMSFAAFGLLPSRFDLSPDNIKELTRADLMRLFNRSPGPLEIIRREFLDEMQSISYLGPLRSHPARHYIISGADRSSVGTRGERTPQLLYRQKRDVLPRVNEAFASFGIKYTLDVKAVGNLLTGEIVVMELSDPRKVAVSPSDVGFGIGQLLPILVEGVVSGGKIICVEQPEIHLHPRLQGHVAEFLITTALSRGNPARAGKSGPVREYGGNQWIVETHSEAMIQRIQTKIKADKLPPDFFSILYVEPMENGGARVRRLRLDEDGEFIDEWPDGFFEENIQELFRRRR